MRQQWKILKDTGSPISVRLTKPITEQLKTYVDENGLNRGAVIDQALKLYFSQEGVTATLNPKFK